MTKEATMRRRHHESADEKAARMKDDTVEDDIEEVEPDLNLIGNPMSPTSREYIDLEIARIQPPA
jgi:hypothetical protein